VAGAEVVDDVRVPAAEALADRATSGRLLPDALPPEAEKAMDEFARDYERRWLDMDIPALAGLTPRQTADDPTSREDLVALRSSTGSHRGRGRWTTGDCAPCSASIGNGGGRIETMKTVVLGQPPAEIAAFLARRRALGQDRFDEVWEGVDHLAPMAHPWHGYLDTVLAELLGPYARQAGLIGTSAFNLGEPSDFRVPDRGYHRQLPASIYVATAAIVVEIVSPDDETWEKFPFYAGHGVDEIGTAAPAGRELRWFELGSEGYVETGSSSLLGVAASDLAAEIAWPG